MKTMLKGMALVVMSLGTIANAIPNQELVLSRAEGLAEQVENLDAALHNLNLPQQVTDPVHDFESVILDFASLLQEGNASKQSVNQAMREIYQDLRVVIRTINRVKSSEVQRNLTAVIRAYKALFYSIYPQQGGGGCGSR